LDGKKRLVKIRNLKHPLKVKTIFLSENSGNKDPPGVNENNNIIA